MNPTDENKDNDLMKGATEDEAPGEKNMTSMAGQLGHRDEDEMIKDADSDFPEPGESPEHSGEVKEPDQRDKDKEAQYAPGRNAQSETQLPEAGNKKKDDNKKDEAA